MPIVWFLSGAILGAISSLIAWSRVRTVEAENAKLRALTKYTT